MSDPVNPTDKAIRASKAWTRQFIACACIIAIIAYSGFALFGNVDLDVFWRVFTALNVYVGWFFISREVEKSK
jgi:hypothetical protein